jgi:hypothetical protein
MIKLFIEQRKYKAGYVVKKEFWKLDENDPHPTPMTLAYTFRGEFIGDVKTAKDLIVKRGIKPTKASKQHSVCSIGYSKKDKRWYGWSHRAICGFKKGDKLFTENYKSDLPETTRDNIPFIKHGRTTIKNNKQAKQSAINFARSVS